MPKSLSLNNIFSEYFKFGWYFKISFEVSFALNKSLVINSEKLSSFNLLDNKIDWFLPVSLREQSFEFPCVIFNLLFSVSPLLILLLYFYWRIK